MTTRILTSYYSNVVYTNILLLIHPTIACCRRECIFTKWEKWEERADDYASVSDSFATLAGTKFHAFKILNGESVTMTQHRFVSFNK